MQIADGCKELAMPERLAIFALRQVDNSLPLAHQAIDAEDLALLVIGETVASSKYAPVVTRAVPVIQLNRCLPSGPE